MTQRAILFPGQGAQFVGMAADLVERSPRAAGMFAAASELMGEDLLDLCTSGPEERVNSTAVSQPAIFVTSLAAVDAIRNAGGEAGLECMGTAGLSLGEYSALVFADAIDFADALEIVVLRGRYMQEACDQHPSGMLSILGLGLEAVQEVVDQARDAGVLAVANVNARNQIVISGEHAALEKGGELALERGARKIVPLRVAGAYHSPLMATASEKLKPALDRAALRSPRIPFYPNVVAHVVSDPDEIRGHLESQIERPVLWAPTLEALVAAGMRSATQPGPGSVVRGLVRQVDASIPVESVLAGDSVNAYVKNTG